MPASSHALAMIFSLTVKKLRLADHILMLGGKNWAIELTDKNLRPLTQKVWQLKLDIYINGLAVSFELMVAVKAPDLGYVGHSLKSYERFSLLICQTKGKIFLLQFINNQGENWASSCKYNDFSIFIIFSIHSSVGQLWKWNRARRGCHSRRKAWKSTFHWCHLWNRTNENCSWVLGRQEACCSGSKSVQKAIVWYVVYNVQ